MPFVFNTVELYVATINEKLWTRAREVCRALGYGKATKATHVIKGHVSPKNYAHKWQLIKVSAASTSSTSISWAKDSRKDDYYANEGGMYEIVFSSQQPKQKTSEDTAAMCCLLMFNSSLQTKWRKTINNPSKKKTIKYKPINRKFWGLMKRLTTSWKTGT